MIFHFLPMQQQHQTIQLASLGCYFFNIVGPLKDPTLVLYIGTKLTQLMSHHFIETGSSLYTLRTLNIPHLPRVYESIG